MRIAKIVEKIGSCFPAGFAQLVPVSGFTARLFSGTSFLGAAVRGGVSRITVAVVSAAVFLCLPLRAATVGVIPLSPEVAPMGDVLTAALSALTNVVVLERAQIQKVLQEQQLALTQPQTVLKVGRLLKAEGLVLLEKRVSYPTNEVLAVRVVAIAPGVVILADEFTLPLSNTAEWANTYATRLQRVLPKLNVKLEEAIPVSIGSLRSSVPTEEGMIIERELTTLLRLRFSQEPSVFVLERRNMEALQTEKELGTSEEPFWNGALVIDGTINRDLVSRTNVTIDVRLASPGRAASEIHATGRRESLPALINTLVTNVLASFGRKGAVTTWQTEAEAEKFFQEAQWAARWGLWQQAWEAADASWSLGKETPSVAAYRLAARGSLILSMHGYLGWEPADQYGFHRPHNSEAMPLLTRTLETYGGLFDRFASPTNATYIGWGSLGLDLLRLSSGVLGWFENQVEFREGNKEQLLRVREATRELNQMLLTNNSFGLRAWKRDLQGLLSMYTYARENSLAEIWISAGCIWSESPRDAIASYRQILKLVEAGSVHARPVKPSEARTAMLALEIVTHCRQALISSKIPLHAWSIKDRETLSALRLEFLQEMASSTNLQIRFDGLRSILATSEDPDVLVAAAEQLVKEVASNRMVIFQESRSVPGPEVLTDLLRRMEPWGVPQSARLERLRDGYAQDPKNNDPEFTYQVWKYLLRILANTNEQGRSFRYPSSAPTPERARELIPEIERLKPEIRQRYGLEQLLSGLKVVAAPESQREEPVRQTNGVRSVAVGSVPPSLTISRVWRIDEQPLPAGRVFTFRRMLGKMPWQDDHLWMARNTYGTEFQGSHPRQALLKFDMTIMRAEIIEAPFESLPADFSEGMTIKDKEIFLKLPNVIWRIDSSGAWKKHPVSIAGRPVAWNKSIVLTGPESIAQFLPESGELRLLASTRRNPPVSALDRLNLNDAVVAVWPDNSLYATASGRLWKFDPKQNDWHGLISATNCGESLQLEAQGVLYRQSGKCGGPKLLGGLRPGVADLEYYAWESGRALGSGSMRDVFTPPIWKSPPLSRIGNRAAQFDGSGIWVFPVLFDFFQRAGPQELLPPTLLFLDPGIDQALEIGIDFVPALAEEAKAYESARVSLYESSGASFLATPEGLAIYIAESGTLLWAPKADVDAALAKARQRQNARASSHVVALTRFDRNGNGWLDDSERRAMRHDVPWQREFSARIDSARAQSLKEHSAEWDASFDSGDKNHDGKLSMFEFNSLVIAQPSSFTERIRGHNGQPFLLTRSCDLDNDGSLKRNEFKDFMADPRLPAEVIRSAEWVTKFGLKVEACDTNDDGVLDSAERAQTYRLLRQKPGQTLSNQD